MKQADRDILAVLAQIRDAAAGGGEESAAYLKYFAIVTQASTDAPVATVMENTLGGVPVWARSAMGIYTITLTGAWTAGAAITMGPLKGLAFGTASNIANVIYTSANVITVITRTQDVSDTFGGNADDLLAGTAVEIRVYPV